MSLTEARLASISGTRAMIAQDEFATLTVLLVDCGAVPADVMAATIRGLATSIARKARGDLETDWQVYPTEAFDRVRELDQLAARIGQHE